MIHAMVDAWECLCDFFCEPQEPTQEELEAFRRELEEMSEIFGLDLQELWPKPISSTSQEMEMMKGQGP